MEKPNIPLNDSKRVEVLKSYSILDTLPELEYDEITFLASHICNTPISLISLIDENRQWFKSHLGLDATETPRDFAFCAHAINDNENVFMVNDARSDVRFYDNPLVTGDPHVIFYAGMPVVSSDGFSLGTLCVIDHEPRTMNESQIKALRALSMQLGRLFELRKKSLQLEAKIVELENQNKVLEKFAAVAAHDIKSPLCSIVMMAELFEEQYAGSIDEEGIELLKMIGTSTGQVTQLIDGILSYSRKTSLLSAEKQNVSINKVIADLIPLVKGVNEVEFLIYPSKEITVFTNKIAMEQIFLNLFVNGIKYNNQDKTVIRVYMEDLKDTLKINVVDNGPGIPAKDGEKIFEIFETIGRHDKFGESGHGIGLATVMTLVKGMGGEIRLVSKEGEGANFEFTIRK